MILLKSWRPQRALYILGSGGHGISLGSVALQSGFSKVVFLDSLISEASNSIPQVFPLNETLEKLTQASFAIAIGDNFQRRMLHSRLVSLSQEFNVDIDFPNVIHPQASIAKYVELGVGNHIFPFACVGANSRISNFVVLNHLSSIDHQSIALDYSSLSPGAVTGGNVIVGKGSALLLSSSVAPKVTIGENSILAANSFLKDCIEDNVLYAGSPAQHVRFRHEGESYL